ncbi:MAG: glycosyl hydrolase 53 family protein [Lachnospiraceae bacterium]|nr:glycosyl hydrolase 53 family protein [Lachnospiraceae bacterium]
MSERKFKGKVTGMLLSLIFVFATVFGAVNLTGVNAQAEETAASEVKLYIRTSKAYDDLYFAPWYKGGMWIATDDQNEHGQYFWGQDQAKLTAIDDSKTLYSIKLMINPSIAEDGFGIYTSTSGANDDRIINIWGGDVYAKLISGESKEYIFDESSWTLTAYGTKTEDTSDEKEATEAIRGADLSSYISIQEAFDQMNADKYQGRTDWGYKDYDGNIIKDQSFFDFLAKQGMNWVRIRVWNDPYDANGNGYGGGTNDVAKAVQMGQWATNAGMKVLIDFHYSDSWADPSRQTAPKAWKSFNGDPDKTAEALSEFTTESLDTLLDAGVDVEMVQVGNETNNGIAGVKAHGNWTENVDKVYAAGCDAVHAVAASHGKNILAAVHFTDPQDAGKQLGYAANLKAGNVDYDVFATSAYPFWHGSASDIQSGLEKIARAYHKQVMVAETSYPYTLSELDGFDDNTVSEKKNSKASDCVYPYTQNGQAQEFRTLANAVSSITYTDGKKAGLGAFYWEGAWNGLVDVSGMSDEEKTEVVAYEETLWSKYGCGWSSKYASEYDVQAPKTESGGAVIENQSFFDADGNALKSLRAFAADYDPATEKIDETLIVDKITSAEDTIEIAPGEKLTADMLGKAMVHYTNGSSDNLEVSWNADEIKEVNESTDYGRTFTVTGEVIGNTVTRTVKLLYPNLLTNGDFETGDLTGWIAAEGSTGAGVESSVGNNTYKGKYSLHFWSESDFSYEISQNVKITEPGVYKLSMVTQGSLKDENDKVYLKADGQEVDDTLGGWQTWKRPALEIKITKSMISSGRNEIKISAGLSATADSWGDFDEINLEKIAEISDDAKPSTSGSTSQGGSTGSTTSGGSSSGTGSGTAGSTGTSDGGSSAGSTDQQTTGDGSGKTSGEESETTGGQTSGDDDKQTYVDTGKTGATRASQTDNGTFITSDGTVAKKTIVADDSGRLYATDKNGRAVKNKSVTIDGKKYVATKDGTLADEGLAKVGKKTFVVKADRSVAKSETVTIGDTTYVAKSNGLLAKKEIVKAADGKRYYADSKGRIAKNKVVKVKGAKYITDSTGAVITGRWITRGKKRYYCSKSGKITKTK